MFDLLTTANLNPLAAFAGGFLTFFASCLLPLVPTYLAYLVGDANLVSSSSQTPNSIKNKRFTTWTVFSSALFFVLGFSLTFILFGLLLGRVTSRANLLQSSLSQIGGIIFLLLGLYLFLPSSWKAKLLGFLQQEHRLTITDLTKKWPIIKKYRYFQAIIFGIIFAAGWSPCIGPMLAVILLWSSQQSTFAEGLLLLTSFSLGLGLPFLLTALLLEKIMPWWQKSQKVAYYLQKIAGLVIMLNGLALLTGQFKNYSLLIIRYLPGISPFTP